MVEQEGVGVRGLEKRIWLCGRDVGGRARFG